MGFRDDQLATKARVDALEQELAHTRAELEAARASKTTAAPPRLALGAKIASALFAVAILAFFGALTAGFFVSAGDVQGVSAVLVLVAALAVSIATTLFVLSRCFVVAGPNELAVLSGRKHRAPDGSVVGFRIVRAARAMRIPVLEQVSYMDLTTLPLSLELIDCRMKDGKATLKATANVKLASELPYVANAVERFLGQDRALVARVAKETLEGTLRGVVAGLSVGAACGEPIRLAQEVSLEAERDMQKLGLVLDTFTVERVDPA